MFGFPAPPLQPVSPRNGFRHPAPFPPLSLCHRLLLASIALFAVALAFSAHAVILWNDPDTTLVHQNGLGNDILGGALKRDDTSNDSLYFKFHVDPLSDKDTEEYFAAFELFDGNTERLGVGNALKAWAYSAFFRASESRDSNNPALYIDLHSQKPEFPANSGAGSYENPRRGTGVTIVFKVQYVSGEDDLLTVWLNPDLDPGANEASQLENLTTRFNANASFDEIRLRHAGQGDGWSFSDLAIATSFTDFVDFSGSRPGEPAVDIATGTRAFSFQSWQKEQGLPQGPVRALAQTSDGYLWLGTDNGLARFDGIRFVPFGLPEAIKSSSVTTLLQDHRGALWVGTSDAGLSCWQNGRFTTFTTQDGLPANSITALAEDVPGRLWVGTDAGLVTMQDSHLGPLSVASRFNGLRINTLFTDRDHTLWASVKSAGIFRLIQEQFMPVTGDSIADELERFTLPSHRSSRSLVGWRRRRLCVVPRRKSLVSASNSASRSQVPG